MEIKESADRQMESNRANRNGEAAADEEDGAAAGAQHGSKKLQKACVW